MRPEHAETALSTPNIDRHKLAAAFIQSLDKLMRGMRLYKGEGPLVEKLLAVCVAAAHPLLDGGEITFRVAPFGLALDGVKITEDDDQLAKALFRFFGDGVRELAILPGLEPAEIVGLATVLRTEPKAGEDDMTTLLWKQQFAHIRHYATDTFQAGPSGAESIDSSLAGTDNDASIAQRGKGSHEAVLSPDDLRLLKDDDTLSWMRRCSAPLHAPPSLRATIDSIRADFAAPPDYAVLVALAAGPSSEAAPVALLLAAYDAFVADGDTDAVLGLLDAVSAGGERALPLLSEMMASGRLLKLTSLYERDHARLTASLGAAVAATGGSLVPLLNALSRGAGESQLRRHLEDGDVELASYYARRMRSEDPEVIVESIVALSKSGTPEAYEAISRALGATLTQVRHAALEAMVGHYVSDARLAIERALRDPDRENRLLALRILEESGDPPVARSILEMAQGVALGDEEELRAAFRALCQFRNPRITEYLARLLGDRNLTRSRAVQTRQLLAVNALREIGTPEAVGTLKSSERSWHLSRPVKDAIGTALRRGAGPTS